MSRIGVELRHEYGPLYKFYIHNPYVIDFVQIGYSSKFFKVINRKIIPELTACSFESQAGVLLRFSRVELMHEYGPRSISFPEPAILGSQARGTRLGPRYKFHTHNL
jgi:hypothetical protein